MEAAKDDGQVASIIAQFLADPLKLFIGGDWLPARSGETFEVVNPANGQILAHAASADAADVDVAVKSARKAFESADWRECSPSHRRDLILSLADAVNAAADELAYLEMLDNGMPLGMAYWAAHLGPVDVLRYFAGWVGKLSGETPSVADPNHHAYTLREPIGVVGAIVPWNGPLLGALAKVAPALAAGCTIVLKPAEQTPLTAVRLGQLVEKVGFPPGVVNIVTGFGETAGRALVNHPDVDKISFTGSTAVGKSIVAAAAGNLKRISLELGGKSPVFVFPDADIELAIQGAATGIFANTGQMCIAGSRLYVHETIFDKIMQGVVGRATALKVGPGEMPGVDMGPVISQAQLDRVTSYVESGREEGAEILTGGRTIGQQGYFMEPTVIAGTNRNMRITREEIFGPVVCAMPFSDDDLDALARIANDTEYGLAAYIWTRDMRISDRLVRKIRAGTIRVNGAAGFVDPAVPFGGFKQSGWGREYGREGVEAFLETKSVTYLL